MIFLRVIIRWAWFECFLSEFEWYRRLHGGYWAHVHVDFPVCSTLWLKVPGIPSPGYREPLWRGEPEFVFYP